MTNMTKDYYKILGVSELCTEQELKSAYRALARKWHPDIAGNTDFVVNKFKEINEAYEILSDKNKRAEYDTVRRYYNYSSTETETKNNKSTEYNTNTKTEANTNSKTTTNPNDKKKENKNTEEGNNFGFNFKWDEFLSKYREYTNKYEEMQSGTKKEKKVKYGNSKKGKNIYTDVEITIAEAVSGTTKIINMLHTSTCPKCNGRKFVNGSICLHCKGKGETSEHKRFTVKIPAGVKDNSKIRLAGEGEKGINGGNDGDLYITVHIKNAIDFNIEGNNIIKTITLAPYEAVLGGNITVKTMDGNVNVKITPNTQNGQKIRLSGCGINKNGKIGDMILVVEIQIPKNLSNIELELYKKLRDTASQNIR